MTDKSKKTTAIAGDLPCYCRENATMT